MAKPHRGRILWTVPGRGKGTCPICGHSSIKLLYEVKNGDKTIMVCKRCRRKDPAKAVHA
jgi:transcription elongation factor Elf1